MITVYKYPLKVTDLQKVVMPFGAIVRKVAFQVGTLMLWAEVDTDAPLTETTFVIFGTGHPISAPYGKLKFLETVGYNTFVWHVYQVVSAWE